MGKTIIEAENEEQFNNTINNFQKDANNEFLNELFELCRDISPKKKRKALEIIKDTLNSMK